MDINELCLQVKTGLELCFKQCDISVEYCHNYQEYFIKVSHKQTNIGAMLKIPCFELPHYSIKLIKDKLVNLLTDEFKKSLTV